jgi:[protein-PII] uridylyltransferase
MLEGRMEPPPLGRTTYHVETTLRFDNSASASSTLLEVVTRDRLGLLYRISNVLSAHGCNIEVVLVDTQGHKAIDVFYLTREGGQIDEQWQASIAQELRRVLDAFSV